jgi:hypothetical protein
MLEEAYGEVAMKKIQVYEWYKNFSDGHKTSGFFCTTHLHFGCRRSKMPCQG